MKDIMVLSGCSIFFIFFGLFTVVSVYQLRNQGSIGQPIRDMYKMNLFFLMPIFLIVDIYLGVNGHIVGYWLLITPISFYLGVMIIHYLRNKEINYLKKS